MRRIIVLGAALIAAAAGPVYAQERVDSRGWDGRELTAVLFVPGAPGVLCVGTQDGIFAVDPAAGKPARRVRGVPQESCRVNALRRAAGPGAALAATQRGLFIVDTASLEARRLFDRSDPQERECADAAQLEDGTLIVSTQGGLFVQTAGEEAWEKAAVSFSAAVPARLAAVKNAVFAAAQEGVFRSGNRGGTWEKVFDAAGAGSAEEEAADDEEAEAPEKKIVDIAASAVDPDVLCLATTFGVFESRDRGRTWQALPLGGLDYATAQSVLIHPVLRAVLCLTRSGLYAYGKEGWRQRASVFEGRAMTGFGTDVLYATRTGLYMCDLLASPRPAGIAGVSAAPSAFVNEPTIEQVQRMAVEYAEVSDRKIKDWRRRASLRAFLPDMTLGYDKTVYGSSTGAFAVGPCDWGVSFKWELGDLVYNGDQTSIDTRSKLMVQLRNDILAEVTRLYFERRRLQVEMALSSKSGEARVEDDLRLQELTALIDRLTGGHFAKVLKSLD
ncbi:MAG: WD40/YVTN/BNR-like repeat-containing protein [Deltaproteobacteria bacterium]